MALEQRTKIINFIFPAIKVIFIQLFRKKKRKILLHLIKSNDLITITTNICLITTLLLDM